MKIIIAPDKFKRSLTGWEFCLTVEKSLKKCLPGVKVLKLPLGDGGDGTLVALSTQMSDNKIRINVQDPLFRSVRAIYLYDDLEKTAFIEMAEASGLRLLNEEEQNCFYTSSFGTGELIKDALDKGAQKIILGIGGSATCDGGMGMATALGYHFLDDQGKSLEPIGRNMGLVTEIDTAFVDPRLSNTIFEVACDVSNPLLGEEGASFVYAPQKGASDEQVLLLDKGMAHFEKVIEKTINKSVKDIPGSGAAGGMGAGALAFLNAELRSGIDLIKDLVKFDERIKGADWIITGEGKLDFQTLSGKTVNGVLESAVLQKIKVAVFCGWITLPQDALNSIGVTYAASVMERAHGLDDALEHTIPYLRDMVAEFAGKISKE